MKLPDVPPVSIGLVQQEHDLTLLNLDPVPGVRIQGLHLDTHEVMIRNFLYKNAFRLNYHSSSKLEREFLFHLFAKDFAVSFKLDRLLGLNRSYK